MVFNMGAVVCGMVLLLALVPSTARGSWLLPAAPLASFSQRSTGVVQDPREQAVKEPLAVHTHRLLVGSAPPTCQGKCGACSPCDPIHVSIGRSHGALTEQEYYPEVWRCKCGNRLFMP